jgi:hypothetical protein
MGLLRAARQYRKKILAVRQSPSQNGMVFETRAYSASSDGTSGDLLRRELTQYDESVYTYTYTAVGINPPFTKTVRAYRTHGRRSP